MNFRQFLGVICAKNLLKKWDFESPYGAPNYKRYQNRTKANVLCSSALILGSTYPSWPGDFRWANNIGTFINLYIKGFTKKAHFFEINDKGRWLDDFLCWKPGLATNIKFSASGEFSIGYFFLFIDIYKSAFKKLRLRIIRLLST